MNKNMIICILSTVILFFTPEAKAELFDRGSGLIYDDSLNITWLQDANSEGTMTWADADDWAGNFVFQGYSDWRLPVSDTECTEHDCANSEMGHLFYSDNVSSEFPDIFTDVKPSIYWSSTEIDENTAWRFNFKYGTQGTSEKDQPHYAWAVRDGDSATPVAPEPLSYLLFIAGSITFLARSRLQRST